jgi:hypothetical protein
MSFLFRWQLIGAHVHVWVFAGPDPGHRAMTGKLVMREPEWDRLHEVVAQTALADVTVERKS